MGSFDFSQNSVIQPGFLICPSASSPVILGKDIKKAERSKMKREWNIFILSSSLRNIAG